MKRVQGFTLIELMIVVAIIGIIAGIALPSYQESVRKSLRSDGLQTLLDTGQRLERCFTTYGTYNNASCSVLNAATINSPKAHYRITVTSAAATYSLTAVPISAQQLKDTKCTSFTLTNTGLKTATGTTSATCW